MYSRYRAVRSKRSLIESILLITAIFLAVSGLSAQSTTPETAASGNRDRRSSDMFAEIAKRVEPAVVSIDTKMRVPEITTRSQNPSENPEDIMEFFRRQVPRRPSQSVGSGFLVDARGHVITNAHVVDEAVKITVRLDSGEEYAASVVGVDIETDIAVLKIDAGKELPFVKLGDSDRARVGDWVLAMGSPFGLSRSVTAGIISHKQRETPGSSPFQKFLQTDAAINRGNSGGPLVNTDGEVIGVNSQIATSTGDYNGVGFALPSNETKYVYEQIVAHGKVRRGFLGVLLDSVKTEFAKVYELGETRGAIVTDVRENDGPAAEAGLKVGDIVTEFNGVRVENALDLISKVASTPPEKQVSLKILREQEDKLLPVTISLNLGERRSAAIAGVNDEERQKLPIDGKKEPAKPFGLTLAELTPQLAATYKLNGQKGLVVKEIDPNSDISDIRSATGGEALGEGDIIQRINRVAVADERSFANAVAKLKKGDAVVLHVAAYDPQTKSSRLKIVQFTVQ